MPSRARRRAGWAVETGPGLSIAIAAAIPTQAATRRWSEPGQDHIERALGDAIHDAGSGALTSATRKLRQTRRRPDDRLDQSLNACTIRSRETRIGATARAVPTAVARAQRLIPGPEPASAAPSASRVIGSDDRPADAVG